jgi:hypothetical protein
VVAGSSPVAIAISKSCRVNNLARLRFSLPIRFSKSILYFRIV